MGEFATGLLRTTRPTVSMFRPRSMDCGTHIASFEIAFRCCPIPIQQDPAAVQNVLEQSFGDVDLSRRLPFANSRHSSRAAPSAASATSSLAATAAVATSRAFAASSSNAERRASKKRKVPDGDFEPLSTVLGVGEVTPGLKAGGGGGEGHCGRRGWLPEEDTRLRQVRPALFLCVVLSCGDVLCAMCRLPSDTGVDRLRVCRNAARVALFVAVVDGQEKVPRLWFKAIQTSTRCVSYRCACMTASYCAMCVP